MRQALQICLRRAESSEVEGSLFVSFLFWRSGGMNIERIFDLRSCRNFISHETISEVFCHIPSVRSEPPHWIIIRLQQSMNSYHSCCLVLGSLGKDVDPPITTKGGCKGVELLHAGPTEAEFACIERNRWTKVVLVKTLSRRISQMKDQPLRTSYKMINVGH